jgi:hypothetical protein
MNDTAVFKTSILLLQKKLERNAHQPDTFRLFHDTWIQLVHVLHLSIKHFTNSLSALMDSSAADGNDQPAVEQSVSDGISGDSQSLLAYDFLSRAAQQNERTASSPDSNLIRTPAPRKVSLSPIRRLKGQEKGAGATSSEHSSDAEANLVVVENPDGSLLEGMPSGFKHSTPIPSPPRSPRTFAFAATGLDLIELFHRHEKVFLGLFLITLLIDAIVLTEEFATLFAGMAAMTNSHHFDWGTRLGEALPYLRFDTASKVSLNDSHMRQTFSVFPPSWTLTIATVIASLDFLVCLSFFVSGFLAYVSKKRKSYAWFATLTCLALIWQVLLSCVDKLSLVLFLFRLACFTHTRFMGDLMDDIALLANILGARGTASEQAPVRTSVNGATSYNTMGQ